MTTQVPGPLNAFAELAGLAEDAWTRLEDRVFALSPLSRYDDLLDAVLAAWPASEEFASFLLDDLLAVQDELRSEGRSPATAAHSLAEQIQPGAGPSFSARIERLLEAPALCRVAAARAVLSATPRRVSGVRLSTEILPVSESYKLGDVCVLVHDLRLTFAADGATSSVNLTLDPPALRDLWAELVHALAVEDQIRERLIGVLDVLDPEGEAGRAPGHQAALTDSQAETAHERDVRAPAEPG